MSLYRFEHGYWLRRLVCMTTLCVAVGLIAKPALAQSPPEQLSHASEKRNDADWEWEQSRSPLWIRANSKCVFG